MMHHVNLMEQGDDGLNVCFSGFSYCHIINSLEMRGKGNGLSFVDVFRGIGGCFDDGAIVVEAVVDIAEYGISHTEQYGVWPYGLGEQGCHDDAS